MKPRTKSILALTGTLIIGMVLGGLITMRMVHNRLDDLREMGNRKGFTEKILKAAKPTPEQEAKIRPLLEDFGERMESMRHSHMLEVADNINEMKDSLSQHLDEKQIARVEKKLKKMRKRRKGKRGPPGPPPHGPHRPDRH